MDSRERVFRALSFEEPDRVPTDVWMSAGFRTKLLSAIRMSEEEFLDAHDIDLRYIEGPTYIGPTLRVFDDGTCEDIWGVRRATVRIQTAGGGETYQEVATSPLANAETVDEIESYDHWPSPDWFDYSTIESQCRTVIDQRRVVVFMGDRMNRIAQLKPAMYIRGVEQILVDMLSAPELASAIFRKIRDFYLRYAERIFEAAKGKIDLLMMGDDFGSQNGPLVSPETWARFLGHGFSEYISLAKSYGVRVIHHTCGSVRQLIPLFIERGLDVLQSLQPEAAEMDAGELKKEFGRRLAFHGGISVQRTMPFGTTGDVRREVEERVRALAPGGGYILCTSHNVQADTPVENFLALLDAYREYGRY